MKFTGKPAGPLGLALLAVTALTGIVLAVHGWSARHSGLAPGTLAGNVSSPATVRPSRPAGSPGPSPSAAPRASGAAPAASPGPLLRAQACPHNSIPGWPRNPRAAPPQALLPPSAN